MPTISVIIPVWNHAVEAVECLESLKRQTFKDFEVIMVDDGSIDGLAERVFDKEYPFPFDFVRLLENYGAPKARNEGFHRSEGKYVIFLDADIALQPDALEKMASALESHPEAAFVYSSFYFGWKLFKGRSFDVEALRKANYIHTSALMRREAFPQFDESLKKFQDWDLWLTIAERGGKGFWIEETLFRLKPRRAGYSHWLPRFMYAIPWDVIGFMPARVRRYREAEKIIRQKHQIATEEMSQDHVMFRRRMFHWLIVVLGFELVSALTIFHPAANNLATIFAGIAMLILTIWRPSWALSLMAVELLIGSKGALLKFGGNASNDGGISVRIVFFAAFLLGWFVLTLRDKGWKNWRALLKGRGWYFALVAMLVYGVVSGWLRGNRATLFSDANAWGTWLAFFPVLDLVTRHRDGVRRDVGSAIMVGLFWLPIKTLALFYFFGHGFVSVASSLYLWVRRTGVGEITLITLNAFRIFFQSHVYAVLAVVSGFTWLSFHASRPKWLRVLLVLSFAEILISLSRSFWIGLAVGLLVVTVLVMRRTKRIPWSAIRTLAGSCAISLLVVAGTLALPLPLVDTSSLFRLLGSRTDLSENAAMSRWALLPVLEEKIRQHPILGSGFGATVSYQSKDPRIVEEFGGWYSTYAFEWGWLEHWIKFGIIGIPVMGWILWSIIVRTWRSREPEWMRVAIVSSLLTLAVIHFFTPYLNHPLGFFLLFAAEALLVLFPPELDRSTSSH